MNIKKLTGGRGRRINDMAVRDMAVPNRTGFEEFEKRERAAFQKEESQAKSIQSLKDDTINFLDCVNEATKSGGTVKVKLNGELDKIREKHNVICVFDQKKGIAVYIAFICEDGAIMYNPKDDYLYFENSAGQVTDTYQLKPSPYTVRKTETTDKANFLLASQAVWDNNDVVGSFKAALSDFFKWWNYVTTPSNFVENEVDEDDILRFSDSRRVKDSLDEDNLLSLVDELQTYYTNGRNCRLRSSNLIDEMEMSQGDMIDILNMITYNNSDLCDYIENMVKEYNDEQEYGDWTDWGNYCREAIRCVKTARQYCYEYLDLVNKGGAAADYATLIDSIGEALDVYYSQL